MDQPWRIQMFGGLRAERGGQVVDHFRSRKAAALFAYLALHCDRSHPREVLIELLWPESEPENGRHKLRAELAWLRKQFELEGTPAGSFIKTDGDLVQPNPAAVRTDVAEFESALRSASQTADGRDLCHIEVRVLDAQGVLVPQASHPIRFEISGPGQLIGVDNGDLTSRESYVGSSRKAFHGKALAVVQSTTDAGRIRLTATSPGLEAEDAIIRSE